ncbi:UDP-N-acetylmuramyl tripeptide synthase [Pseudomonas syringae pv. actinidiae]|uniref:UDP-N-acetylmuramyl tripeptide synthase n=1 Tax=Pseudomonas syringae pv. actinidiae TaxID=103796 RepID=A0A2V0QQI0_PSESF|nr:UDP-N-acetylmuramyl tripeptide synthase [Pseudomonas syringae pv. actinidiae]GBH15373.1 UDP-N-acetylmuramyl tripeptide synthase [Pseudomonas syringae pv. actinidiae]
MSTLGSAEAGSFIPGCFIEWHEPEQAQERALYQMKEDPRTRGSELAREGGSAGP